MQIACLDYECSVVSMTHFILEFRQKHLSLEMLFAYHKDQNNIITANKESHKLVARKQDFILPKL